MPLIPEGVNGKEATHPKMLNMKQYGIQLTRRFHSTMLIHGSLDTGAFSPISPLHYSKIFTCPRILHPDTTEKMSVGKSFESTASCLAQAYRELVPLRSRLVNLSPGPNFDF